MRWHSRLCPSSNRALLWRTALHAASKTSLISWQKLARDTALLEETARSAHMASVRARLATALSTAKGTCPLNSHLASGLAHANGLWEASARAFCGVRNPKNPTDLVSLKRPWVNLLIEIATSTQYDYCMVNSCAYCINSLRAQNKMKLQRGLEVPKFQTFKARTRNSALHPPKGWIPFDQMNA